MPNVGTLLMTVAEASELLGVSQQRGYALARGCLSPAVVRLGRQVRFHRHKLLALIDAGGSALPGGWRHAPPQDTQ